MEGAAGAGIMAEAMAQALATAFQNIKIQPGPPNRLTKFYGPPRKAGDLSIYEWLEEVSVHCRQMGLGHEDQVQTIIDHLGGDAKEEVLCAPAEVRQDLVSVTSLLKARFAPQESVQSLNSAFHARLQLGDETLAEYSRALMRLYSRLESVAGQGREGEAFALLRDNALKGQLIRGVRDPLIKRELRRIDMASEDQSFSELREEALKLFQDEVEFHSQGQDRTEGYVLGVKSAKPKDSSLDKLVTGQEKMMEGISNINTQIGQLVQVLTKDNRDQSNKLPLSEVVCHYCKEKGHFIKDCKKRKRLRGPNAQKTDGTCTKQPTGALTPHSTTGSQGN